MGMFYYSYEKKQRMSRFKRFELYWVYDRATRITMFIGQATIFMAARRVHDVVYGIMECACL